MFDIFFNDLKRFLNECIADTENSDSQTWCYETVLEWIEEWEEVHK